ncbi:MAG: NAD(P)-dependent oxidoreductase [Rubricoccaceae bacterium]
MHLTVFGATGRTGVPLVRQALARGHRVTAHVRTPSRLPADLAARATVVQGDVLDAASVARAVEGADAVLLALAPTSGTGPPVQTRGTEHVVAAMRVHGVARVVSLTGAGVPDARDEGGLGPAVVRGVMRLVVPGLLADARGHADVLRASGLDYTIVRAPRLTRGPATGRYRSGFFALGPGHQISRADAAAFMLDCAERGLHSREAPVVTGTA